MDSEKPSIRVRVLVEAVYNDADHRALPLAHVGDEINIAAGDYATWLREQGMVLFVDTSDERLQLERAIADLQSHMAALELEQQVLKDVVDEKEGDTNGSEEDNEEGDEGREEMLAPPTPAHNQRIRRSANKIVS